MSSGTRCLETASKTASVACSWEHAVLGQQEGACPSGPAVLGQQASRVHDLLYGASR